jgi:hypothetical protein
MQWINAANILALSYFRAEDQRSSGTLAYTAKSVKPSKVRRTTNFLPVILPNRAYRTERPRTITIWSRLNLVPYAKIAGLLGQD